MSEHRVSMLGASLRCLEDPEHSRDPRVRALVDALQSVDYAPAPAPGFRAELRAQLVAVAPRIVAESTPATEPATTTRATTTRGATLRVEESPRRRRFAHPIAVAAGVAAAFLLLLGGAVWHSQKSLPGDSLYGLKRASENVRLAMSSGGTDRGHTYLKLARTRVEEARALLRRDSSSAAGGGTLAGGLSPHTARLVSANLASADSDLTHGTDLLTTQAVTARSQSPILIISAWVPGQLEQLHELAAAVPPGSLRKDTAHSTTLTDSALARARSLAPAVASGCASTARTDSLGPVPTCGAGATSSTPTPSTPASSSTPVSSDTPKHGQATGSGTGGTSSRTGASNGRPGGSAPTPGRQSHPPAAVPTLPRLPSVPGAPVSVGSCGVSVVAGPVHIGVGGCPSHS